MGSHFIRLILQKLCVYAMAGSHHTYLLTVFAAKPFTISHAFSCPHGAFPIICHNDVQDLTAKLMLEVCHDVQVEAHLQPLSGELLCHKSAIPEDDVRVDIRAAGFWGCRHHRSFFDVRVFNAFAKSNQSPCPAATFRRHEGDKHQAYEESVHEVERGSFTPLVFSSGAWGGLPQLLTGALPPFLVISEILRIQ